MVREPAAVLARTAAALAALAVVDLVFPHIDRGAGTALQIAGLALISIPLATLCPLLLSPLSALGLRLLGGAAVAVGATAVLIWAGYPGTAATLTKLVAASLIGLALGSLLQSPV